MDNHYSKDEAVKSWNKLRRQNKGQWVYWCGHVEGKYLEVKSFDEWIQYASYNGFTDGGPSDGRVKDSVEWLDKFISEVSKY